jgi:hypothetical protein
MTLEEAMRQLRKVWTPEHAAEQCLYRSGKITLDASQVERGVIPCPHCGQRMGMGMLTLRHADGRAVRFRPGLFHYVEAGHPIEGVDVDALIAIMADA